MAQESLQTSHQTRTHLPLFRRHIWEFVQEVEQARVVLFQPCWPAPKAHQSAFPLSFFVHIKPCGCHGACRGNSRQHNVSASHLVISMVMIVMLNQLLKCPRELIKQGCPAYDCGLGEEVLVTTTLLCFLADSPMHADITSTVMPANARNPCRACDLSVLRASQKKTMAYLQFFLQISADGVWVCPDVV